MLVNTIVSKPIKKVVALSNIENITTDILNEIIITKGLKIVFFSHKELQSIIGKSGKTQGARTVSIQDKKETNNIIILKLKTKSNKQIK